MLKEQQRTKLKKFSFTDDANCFKEGLSKKSEKQRQKQIHFHQNLKVIKKNIGKAEKIDMKPNTLESMTKEHFSRKCGSKENMK